MTESGKNNQSSICEKKLENILRIIYKLYAHFQVMTKASEIFQKNLHKTVTIYSR